MMQLLTNLNQKLDENSKASLFVQKIHACLGELDTLTMIKELPDKNQRGMQAFYEISELVKQLKELSTQLKPGMTFYKQQEIREEERKPLEIALTLFADYLNQRGYTNDAISCQII